VDLDLVEYDWYAELEVDLPGSHASGDGTDLRWWADGLGRPVCRIGADGADLVCVQPETDLVPGQ
jgi:hypothetical protein